MVVHARVKPSSSVKRFNVVARRTTTTRCYHHHQSHISSSSSSTTAWMAGAETAPSVTGMASATSTTATKHSTAQKDAYTTIAVSRDLTSGATLAATYNTFDSSLTLKASVAF